MTFTYDENSSSPTYGYLKEIENGAGDIVTIDSYNALGDITSITTNPASGVTRTIQTEYDAAQRETTYEHADGKTVETAHDGANATEVTDEAGNLIEYEYCAECGKLTGMSGPLSWALAWVLDDDYDITTFSDARSKNTTYQYGAARELKKIVYPDSTYEEFQYDNYGRLKSEYNGLATLSKTYDSGGKITASAGSSTTAPSYTYHSNGLLKTAYTNSSTTEYFYTGSHLIQKIKYTLNSIGSSKPQWIEYDYNPDQTIQKMRWINNTTLVAEWEYDYDGAGRVTEVVNSFGETTTFTYDGEGKILSQTNHNGTSREYTYNNQRGWPTDIVYKNGTTTTESFNLVYDDGSNTVGNLTDVTELSTATVAYSYDDLYRLTAETRTGTPSYSRTYGYDLAGNITTIDGNTFGTYDDANKPTQISTSTNEEYNGAGSLVRWTGVPNHGYLEWFSRNKLKKCYYGDDYKNYDYLANGLRHYATGNKVSAVSYIYAGDILIGEFSGTSSPAIVYTWGPDGLISKRTLSSSTSHWYEFGPQGETRRLTDSSGAAVNTYYYNAYGKIISSTGSVVNPFKYGAKYGYYTDNETGHILAGQRWYSPEMMRWLSRDPINYAGGVNLYEYVKSNPLRYYDSTGTIPLDTIWDLGNIIYDIYWEDYESLGPDCAALFVPYLPAGIRKVARKIPTTCRSTNASNKCGPDPQAAGPHSTYKRAKDGKVTNYTQWKPNSKNPTGYEVSKRYDSNGRPHYNKKTGNAVAPPHIHDPNAPGGIRKPEEGEQP